MHFLILFTNISGQHGLFQPTHVAETLVKLFISIHCLEDGMITFLFGHEPPANVVTLCLDAHECSCSTQNKRTWTVSGRGHCICNSTHIDLLFQDVIRLLSPLCVCARVRVCVWLHRAS